MPAGCNRGDGQDGTGDEMINLQLNWKAQPQFGGFYAAEKIGAYEKHGLNVKVVEGGVGTPTVQMVGAGKANFAVVSGDELVVARTMGNDVVALFAVYQTCPQGIMVHKSRGLAGIADVFESGGTVAMQEGLPYAHYLKHKYGFDKVDVRPSPGGNLAQFRDDENFAQQVFVTEEPILARKAGLEVQTFLVADSGYNPYTTVLVTSGDYLREHPGRVKAMVRAVREGWRAYLDDPAPANEAMNVINPTMDLETFAQSAEAQVELIETEETKKLGLGAMTKKRWATLGQQLVEAGVINEAPPADECFVDVETLE